MLVLLMARIIHSEVLFTLERSIWSLNLSLQTVKTSSLCTVLKTRQGKIQNNMLLHFYCFYKFKVLTAVLVMKIVLKTGTNFPFKPQVHTVGLYFNLVFLIFNFSPCKITVSRFVHEQLSLDLIDHYIVSIFYLLKRQKDCLF